MAEDRAEPVLPLAVPIGTRDGSLTKDSRLVNCFAEQIEGQWSVRKRPGTVIGATVPSGVAQGIGLHNGGVWAILSDKIYQIDLGGSPTPTNIPGVTHPGQQYQVLSNVSVGTSGFFISGFKSRYGAWVVDGPTITQITSADYPAETCEGIAWLNGVTYVTEISVPGSLNTLRGSALEDPFTWPPLDFLSPTTNSGSAVYMCNYLNYIALFTEFGLQMFYDAGNPTGIAISPVTNASWLTGCGASASVVKVVDDLYFLSNSAVTGYAITVLRGLTLSNVSTPAVERVLNAQAFTTAYAQSFRVSGHSFYSITGVTGGGSSVTVTYDITTQQWSQWTSFVSGSEIGFVGVHCINRAAAYYMQDRVSGTCLLLSDAATQDDLGTVRGTQPIYTRIVTHPYDWNTLKRKFINAVYLLADTVAATISLRYSDDDYTALSSAATIDLSTEKKMALKLGSSRRRSWELLHTAATTLRVYGLDTEITKGNE